MGMLSVMRRATVLFAAGMGLFAVQAVGGSGPVVHLTFDEGEGLVSKDRTGHGFDAALVNAGWEAFGVHGKALRLNGKDACFTFPKVPELVLTNDFSWSVWYKSEKRAPRFALFTRGGWGSGWSTSNHTGYFQLIARPGAAATCLEMIASGTDALSPWVHLTMTATPRAEGGMLVRFYKDGKRCDGRGQREFVIPENLRARPDIPLAFGQGTSEDSGWFDGIVDEVKVWNRALSDEEVAADHAETAKPVAEDDGGAVATLPHVKLPALRRTRVAVFNPPDDTTARQWMVRSPAWFRAAAEKAGCTVTLIDNAVLEDATRFNAKNFDTLLMPIMLIPFEAEDTLFEFLKDGGNVLTPSANTYTYKRRPDGTYDTFGSNDGNRFLENSRGWHVPFLVRVNPAPHAQRKRMEPLRLDAAVGELVGDLLPAALPADPAKGYSPLCKWDKTATWEGSYGDPANYALAADLKVELYKERAGIGSGFAVYRYHNAEVNGATLAHLGGTGTEVLNGPDGEKALAAILHLFEMKLPGEQDDAFYADAIRLHVEMGEFAFEFGEWMSVLRNAAAYAHLVGGDWRRHKDDLDRLESRRMKLTDARNAQRSLLWLGQEPDRVRTMTRDALADLADIRAVAAKAVAAARQTLSAVPEFTKPSVRHKYGTLPSIASSVMPMNLHRARHRVFRTIRRVGCNVWSGKPFEKWYCEDPEVRRQLEGFWRDFKFCYPVETAYWLHGGTYNPTTGTVTDEPMGTWESRIPIVTKDLAYQMSDFAWMGTNRFFRVGQGDETGLSLRYWGSEPEREFRAYLRNRYGTVGRMNAECASSYGSFDEVKLPLRQPVTRTEHAVWENWRNCREAKLVGVYRDFRALVKRMCPSLDVFATPSAEGATLSPLFAVNMYLGSREQDVCGCDGTSVPPEREWTAADLLDKRFLTSEFGGLYQEQPLPYVYYQYWQELSIGSLGFEQHIWSFGNDGCNFADFLDVATPYGGLLKTILSDTRKFDWLFLDGDRAVPEVGILHSYTSRMHDQGWGSAGAPRASNHLVALSSYYVHFLKWGRSARAIEEESIRSGVPAGVKAMVLPQTLYLDGEIQDRLLEFAERGGVLVLEGRAGAFSAFGAPDDRIFAKTGLLPFPSVAPQRKPYGKGQVVFLGRNLGLEKDPDFSAAIEGVLRDAGIGERFSVSDDAVLLREWRHDGRTYLVAVSQRGKNGKGGWGVEETEIAVRGKVGVTDVLFGKPVRTLFKDGYTVFRTVTACGGRVFALTGDVAAPSAEALARKPKYAQAERKALAKARHVTLPFDEHFFDLTPLTDGEYTFTLTTVSDGFDRHKGETYVSVSKGGERLKKRLYEHVPTCFRMRGATYRITSKDNFCMYPFYADARIERTEAPPPAKAEVGVKGGAVSLKNEFLALEVDSLHGATVRSLRTGFEGYAQIVGKGAFAVCGAMPGPFRNAAFDVETTSDDCGVTALFRQKDPTQGALLTERISVPHDRAEVAYDIEVKNASDAARTMTAGFHPELCTGPSMDGNDWFDVPQRGGLFALPNRAQGISHHLEPSEGWAAVADSVERMAIVTRFDLKQTGGKLYMWEGVGFCTVEPELPPRSVAAGESMRLNLRHQLFRGVGGVHGLAGDFAAHLLLRPVINQAEPFAVTLEVASLRRESEKMTVRAKLVKGGTDVARLTCGGDGTVSFEQPAKASLSGDLSSVPDGAYELLIGVSVAGERLLVRRPVAFVGQKAKALEAKVPGLKARVTDKAKMLPAEKAFALQIKAAEFERLVWNDPAAAEKKLAEIEADLN